MQRQREREGGRQMMKGLAFLAKVFIGLWVLVMVIGILAGPGLREQEKRDDARDRASQQHRVERDR